MSYERFLSVIRVHGEQCGERGEVYWRDTPAAAVLAVIDSSLTDASMLLEICRTDALMLLHVQEVLKILS